MLCIYSLYKYNNEVSIFSLSFIIKILMRIILRITPVTFITSDQPEERKRKKENEWMGNEGRMIFQPLILLCGTGRKKVVWSCCCINSFFFFFFFLSEERRTKKKNEEERRRKKRRKKKKKCWRRRSKNSAYNCDTYVRSNRFNDICPFHKIVDATKAVWRRVGAFCVCVCINIYLVS